MAHDTSRPSSRDVGVAGSSQIVFDDLQVSLSAAKTPPASAPTWRTYDFGLGGPAFSVLGFAIGDYIDFYMQTSHAMKLQSTLDNHLHGTLPSNDAGKRIQLQLDVIAAGIGDQFAAVAGSPFTKEMLLAGTEANKHNYIEIADIPGVNTTVSSVYLCRLTRIAASADDYPLEVYLIYNDSHYQLDTVGSLQCDSKV